MIFFCGSIENSGASIVR